MPAVSNWAKGDTISFDETDFIAKLPSVDGSLS